MGLTGKGADVKIVSIENYLKLWAGRLCDSKMLLMEFRIIKKFPSEAGKDVCKEV